MSSKVHPVTVSLTPSSLKVPPLLAVAPSLTTTGSVSTVAVGAALATLSSKVTWLESVPSLAVMVTVWGVSKLLSVKVSDLC